MAENKRYYWLKFKEDFFTSKRIKKLRKLGADYLIIYLKMQLKALKTNGYLYITGIEDNIADEIALDIDEDTDKVQLTLSYLQACDLLEISEDGVLFLPYVEILTDSETQDAIAKRRQRANKKLQLEDKKRTLSRQSPPEIEIDKDKELDIEKDIVSYLNEKCGTKYRANSDKTRKHIRARLSEGYTLEDFKAVIDKKYDEWSNDPKMAQYLRPETLFGTKFEGYLNQKAVKPQKSKSSFNNFSQRDYDYDALEKKLLGF